MTDYKKQAKNIVKKMKSMGIEISHAQSLEVIAAINGFNCWSAMKKSVESKNEQVNDISDGIIFPQTGLSEDLKKTKMKIIEEYESSSGHKISPFPLLGSSVENWKITDKFGTIISAKVSEEDLFSLLKHYPAQEIIKTEIHSDDYVFSYTFSSELWFKQASDKEILDLMKCGFGGDLPADRIADFFEPINRKIETVLDYAREKQEMGFEVEVDPISATNWIKKHRPHLMTYDD